MCDDGEENGEVKSSAAIFQPWGSNLISPVPSTVFWLLLVDHPPYSWAWKHQDDDDIGRGSSSHSPLINGYGQALEPTPAVRSESKSLRWSAHRSPNHTRQKGRKTLGLLPEEPQQVYSIHRPRALFVTSGRAGGATDHRKSQTGQGWLAHCRNNVRLLISDVLVGHSTYAPCVSISVPLCSKQRLWWYRNLLPLNRCSSQASATMSRIKFGDCCKTMEPSESSSKDCLCRMV